MIVVLVTSRFFLSSTNLVVIYAERFMNEMKRAVFKLKSTLNINYVELVSKLCFCSTVNLLPLSVLCVM